MLFDRNSAGTDSPSEHANNSPSLSPSQSPSVSGHHAALDVVDGGVKFQVNRKKRVESITALMGLVTAALCLQQRYPAALHAKDTVPTYVDSSWNTTNSERKSIPAKVPSCIQLALQPFVEEVECSKAAAAVRHGSSVPSHDRQRLFASVLDTDRTIRWRKKPLAKKNECKDEQQETQHDSTEEFESNASLVQWSDGSWTLCIGETHYECRRQAELSHIVERLNSEGVPFSHPPIQQDLLVWRNTATEQLILRPLSLSSIGPITAHPVRSKSTQLTTTTLDTLESAFDVYQHRSNPHSARSPEQPPSSANDFTAKFLEEDDDVFSSEYTSDDLNA